MPPKETRSQASDAAVALGEQLREARENLGKSRPQVAADIEISQQFLYQIEAGSAVASLSTLARLHAYLHPTGDSQGPEQRHRSLSDWLTGWLAVQVGKAHDGQDLDDLARSDLAAALKLIQTPSGQAAALPGSDQKLLTNFPHAFYPLMVICGDRREQTPSTQGDIFAYSLSITDLMYIFDLKLDGDRVKVRSDKLVATMENDYLASTLGQHNLLVIGSPAVNLAARKINEGAVFRFPFDERIRKFQDTLHNLPQLRDERYLRAFWRMASRNGVNLGSDAKADPKKAGTKRSAATPVVRTDDTALPFDDEKIDPTEIKRLEESIPKLMGQDTVQVVTRRFQRTGFIDPADNRLQGFYTRRDNDFACISLAPNPYDETGKHVAILVAGLHGPGTAHALRMLGRRTFGDHPLGGIVEVELPRYADWPSTLENGRPDWQTKSYTLEKIIENLEAALKAWQGQLPDPYTVMTRDEVEQCIKFVRQFIVQESHAGDGVSA